MLDKMARIVILNEKSPLKLEINGVIKSICRCGLSKNFPICDSSHKTIVEDDNKLYQYINGEKIEIEKLFQEELK